jgi:hypothetical protein
MHKKTNRRILIATDLKTEIMRRLAELESRLDTQPVLRSQEELAGIIRDYFRGAFGLAFEFTNEELITTLAHARLNPLLHSILERFFRRINVLEFSGLTVAPVALRALIVETREIVMQTAVLSVDDLREREHTLAVRDIPEGTPSLDKGYLLLSEVQLALRFGKLELADALYSITDHWYAQAPVEEQRVIYEDLVRLYDELRLAHGGETASAAAATTAAATGVTPIELLTPDARVQRLAQLRAETIAVRERLERFLDHARTLHDGEAIGAIDEALSQVLPSVNGFASLSPSIEGLHTAETLFAHANTASIALTRRLSSLQTWSSLV